MNSLGTSEIRTLLNNDIEVKKCFVGVFPANKIPFLSRSPACYVANFDVSAEPGTHWIAVYIPEVNKAEYYDSFGLPPTADRDVAAKIAKYDTIYWNTKRIQRYGSTACGYHCVFYLTLRCRGFSLKDVTDIFRSNYNRNDELVFDFVRRRS